MGLGAFGVVTRVTLDIQPTYEMRQDAFMDLPWSMVFDNFDTVSSAARSVSLFTKWCGRSVDRIWLKTHMAEEASLDKAVARLGVVAAPVHMISSSPDAPEQRLNPFGLPGPWSARLPHFRSDRELDVADQLQSEYMVPRTQTVRALQSLRRLSVRIDPLLHTTEIRTMAADHLWLSPSYGHDTVGVHFTWQKRSAEVDVITREIEDVLLPLGARPHWGKLVHADAAALHFLYPRMDDFRALATRSDPTGKFRNAYLEAHVFG